MPEIIVGMGQFERRIAAISGTPGGLMVMRTLARDTIAYLKSAVPRKTSTTGRQFRAEHVTASGAEITGSKVAQWIDEGTGLYGPRHHVIVPKTKKALAFPSQGLINERFGVQRTSSLRLSGRLTSAASREFGNAAFVVVRSIKGMKPRPFIDKAVRDASHRNTVLVELTKSWDRA